MHTTASSFWTACESTRNGLMTRTERYAALTVPKVMLPVGHSHENTDQAHDYQSLGAQAVNHVVNKLMLALFAPSRPFLKLMPGKKTKDAIAKINLTLTQLDNVLAEGERSAVRELDVRAQRPRLYQLLRHLVVTGNALLYLGKESLRSIGLRNYVIKRNIEGIMLDLVIREQVKFNELDSDIITLLRLNYQDETKVDFYKWIHREHNGSYTMTQWVNENLLPDKFNGRWPAAKLPYRALTWDLADESDYGTGLVEEYSGDFEALSALAEATTDGAVLGTEYRWLVNPTGQTTVEDLNNSVNGDALPGLPTDVSPTQGGNPDAITVAQGVSATIERRISRGFLMGSSLIRDAERVTQEEVRLTANELETAYGGVYSTLAADLQLPVGGWLFDKVELPLANSDLKITIVTGLDALSRSGDLDNFRLAMGDLAAIAQVPEHMQGRFKMQEIGAFIGQGRGIDMSRFIKSDQEYAKEQADAAAARTTETVSTTAGVTAAEQGTTNV